MPQDTGNLASKTWEKTLKRFGTVGVTIAALVGAIVGLVSIYQVANAQKEAVKLERASLDSHLEEVMMSMDKHFVTYPGLRKYFYRSRGRESYPQEGQAAKNAALGTAELIIDFADDAGAYERNGMMTPSMSRHWAQIIRPYFAESPVTREIWAEDYAAYDEWTACILGAPPDPRAVHWHWATNRPRAEVWHRKCV